MTLAEKLIAALAAFPFEEINGPRDEAGEDYVVLYDLGAAEIHGEKATLGFEVFGDDPASADVSATFSSNFRAKGAVDGEIEELQRVVRERLGVAELTLGARESGAQAPDFLAAEMVS